MTARVAFSAKGPVDQWKLVDRQLKDADNLLILRLEYLLFDATDPYSRVRREYFDSDLLRYHLLGLRRQVDALLSRIERERKADALENVEGRSPEEAELYRSKARELREAR